MLSTDNQRIRDKCIRSIYSSLNIIMWSMIYGTFNSAHRSNRSVAASPSKVNPIWRSQPSNLYWIGSTSGPKFSMGRIIKTGLVSGLEIEVRTSICIWHWQRHCNLKVIRVPLVPELVGSMTGALVASTSCLVCFTKRIGAPIQSCWELFKKLLFLIFPYDTSCILFIYVWMRKCDIWRFIAIMRGN